MNFKTAALLMTLPLALFGCPEEDPTDPIIPTPTAPTGDTTPTPVTPPPDPTFTVTLMDEDGVSDATGGTDDDTLTLVITDPPDLAWEFGYAQTAVGATAGWFGEDCLTGDTCHPVPAPDPTTNVSTLVLTRVATPSGVVAGSTMLLPVDEPESATPDLTYYIGAVGDADDTCFVFGDDPTYYASLNCMDPGAAASSND